MHTGLERQPRPLRRARCRPASACSAAASCCCPARSGWPRGETYTSPWLYGAYGDGLDEVARRFHRHLRARPRPVAAERPVTLNVWEAVYFDHDRDRLLDLADRAAAVGVERFVLDDGWFGARRDDRAGLGDWVVSAEVWPDGLHPLVDRVRELGMQFGLWFEPEMVNPDSDVARAHPEWIMAARPEWPVESRHQQVLNLGIPEAYAHVKGQILALLDEYDIGYIKWDHNRDLIEAGTQTDGGRPGVHAQTLAFYRLLDELRAAHPDLEIESCSSGGARVDLAVLERTDRVWVSDNIDPHDRQRMLRWTGQLLPPEYLGSHIASGRSHATGRQHDLGFRAGTAIFGHLGIEWDLAEASDAETRRAQRPGSRSTRSTAASCSAAIWSGWTGRGTRIHLHGVVAPDRSRALFAFAPVDSLYPDPAPRLRFRGLDPERTYRVRPVIVGSAPSGLRPPRWWGGPGSPGASLHRRRAGARRRRRPDRAPRSGGALGGFAWITVLSQRYPLRDTPTDLRSHRRHSNAPSRCAACGSRTSGRASPGRSRRCGRSSPPSCSPRAAPRWAVSCPTEVRTPVLVGAGATSGLLVAQAAVVDHVADLGAPGLADLDVWAWFVDHRSAPVTFVMKGVSVLADTPGMAVLAIIAAALLWRGRRRPEAAVVLAATIGATLLIDGFKRLYGRVRPPAADQLMTETNPALPSGHALGSIVVLGVLAAVVAVGHPPHPAPGRGGGRGGARRAHDRRQQAVPRRALAHRRRHGLVPRRRVAGGVRHRALRAQPPPVSVDDRCAGSLSRAGGGPAGCGRRGSACRLTSWPGARTGSPAGWRSPGRGGRARRRRG